MPEETTPTTISFDVPKDINNSKLRGIAKHSARNLLSLMADHEEEILQVLHESDDGKATLSHALRLDFGMNRQTDKLSFSLKHGDEVVQEITDPDQGDLFNPPTEPEE